MGYLHFRKPPCGSMFFVPLLFSMVSGRCFLYVLGEGIWIRHIIVSHLGRSTSSPAGILMVYHSQSWLGTLTSVFRECSWDRIRTHNGMALGSSWDITITKTMTITMTITLIHYYRMGPPNISWFINHYKHHESTIKPLIWQLNAILGAPSCTCLYYIILYIH